MLDAFPGKEGRGDAFPMREARARVDSLVPKLAGNVVVLLGKRVAAAFGMKRPKYLERVKHRGLDVVVLPHPSGVNRWWNDARNVHRASACMGLLWRECQEDECRRLKTSIPSDAPIAGS